MRQLDADVDHLHLARWLFAYFDGYARRRSAMSQFAEILNELQARGDKQKLMQLSSVINN